MTVSTTANKKIHQGNDVATSFDFPYTVHDRADLRHIHVAADGTESPLQEGTDYLLSLNPDGTASATYPAAGSGRPVLPQGEALVQLRVISYDQPSNIPNQGPYFGDTVERMADRQVMMAQQLDERIERAVKVPVSDNSGASFVMPAPQPNRVVGVWDSQAQNIVIGPTAAEITSAGSNAASALASAAAAQQHAEDARVFEGNKLFANSRAITIADSPFMPAFQDNGLLILADCSGGSVTVSLPTLASVGEGFRLGIFKIAGSADLIVSAQSGDGLAASGSVTLGSDADFVIITSHAAAARWQAKGQFDGSVASKNLTEDARPYDIAFTAGFDDEFQPENLALQTYSKILMSRTVAFHNIHAQLAEPADGTITIQIYKNGVGIFNTTPKIFSGSNVLSNAAAFHAQNSQFFQGDQLDFRLTAVGSSIPGKGLICTLSGALK